MSARPAPPPARTCTMKCVSQARHTNPMAIKLPGAPPLTTAQRAQFLQQTSDWSNKLALLRNTNLAALD